MSTPRISVVIPVHNRPLKLAAAVASLASEAALIYEVVIVDDASSTPVNVEPPSELDGRVRIIRLEVNGGAARARQVGIDAAHGNVIAFLDSDDVWLPGKLAAQLPLLKEDELIAVACGWQVVDTNGGKSYTRMPVASDDPADFATGCWFSPGSTVILPRAAFALIGPLDSTLRRLEDLDWFMRFALGGGRLVVASVIGAVIVREARSNLSTVDGAAERIGARFAKDPRASRQVNRRLAAWLAVERAFARWTERRFLGAAWFLACSLLLAPRPRLQLRKHWRIGPPFLPDAAARRLLSLEPVSTRSR